MRFLLNLLLIIIFVLTLCICAIKPDMHKSVIIYDSDFKLVTEEQLKTEEKVIPIMEKQIEPVKVTKKVEKPVTVETKQIKTVENKTSSQKQTVKQPVVKTVKQTTAPKQQTVAVEKQKTVIPKSVETATKKDVVQIPDVKTVTQKPLTEREEEIAWNTWRSNIQNKIMQDVKLPIIPSGIVFKFTFTVDKFGKISDVQTWSSTPSYTPYAIQYIAPVIRGYQGKSILNFPEGTARTVTTVKGGWRISENERYSTPQDYNDVEKVKR